MRYLPVLFVLPFFFSCGKEIKNFEITPDKRQVLSAYFTDLTDSLTLFLSNSVSSTGSQESQGITNAEVHLLENGVKVLNLKSKGDGFYMAHKGSFEFKEGLEYELKSKVEGLPDISAKAIFVSEVKLDSLTYARLSEIHGQINMWFKDPIERENYYGFFKGQYFVDSIKQYFLTEEIKIHGVPSYNDIESDFLFNGQDVKAQLQVSSFDGLFHEIGEPGTKLKAIMFNTEKVWYEYEKAVPTNVLESDDGFGIHSTTNLPTNVTGGYGIFGLANASTIEITF